MNEDLKKELFSAVDESVKKNLADLVGVEVAERVAQAVKNARIDSAITGRGISRSVDADTVPPLQTPPAPRCPGLLISATN